MPCPGGTFSRTPRHHPDKMIGPEPPPASVVSSISAHRRKTSSQTKAPSPGLEDKAVFVRTPLPTTEPTPPTSRPKSASATQVQFGGKARQTRPRTAGPVFSGTRRKPREHAIYRSLNDRVLESKRILRQQREFEQNVISYQSSPHNIRGVSWPESESIPSANNLTETTGNATSTVEQRRTFLGTGTNRRNSLVTRKSGVSFPRAGMWNWEKGKKKGARPRAKSGQGENEVRKTAVLTQGQPAPSISKDQDIPRTEEESIVDIAIISHEDISESDLEPEEEPPRCSERRTLFVGPESRADFFELYRAMSTPHGGDFMSKRQCKKLPKAKDARMAYLRSCEIMKITPKPMGIIRKVAQPKSFNARYLPPFFLPFLSLSYIFYSFNPFSPKSHYL
jgi:hypothetical protein